MITIFKKIVVYILLLSFLLVDLPQGVFASAPPYSSMFGTSSENNSVWSLNPAVAAGSTNQKLLTHTIKSTSNTNFKFQWEQSIRGEHLLVNKTGVGGTNGFYLYKLTDYYEKGVKTELTPGTAYQSDIYVITSPGPSSGGGVPTPSLDSIIYQVVYLVNTDQAHLVESSCWLGGYTCLKSVSDPNAIYYFHNITQSFSWPNDSLTSTLQPYLTDTGLWVDRHKPKITTAVLPKPILDHCESKTIKPDSQNGWALMHGLTDASSDIQKDLMQAVKAAGGTGTDSAKKVDYQPFENADSDLELYHKFYSSKLPGQAGFYPDRSINSGNSLDVIYAESLASIWTWSDSDYQNWPGTNVNLWTIGKGVLGLTDFTVATADLGAGVAATKAGIAAIKVKVGTRAAAKIAQQNITALGYSSAQAALTAGDEAAHIALLGLEKGTATAATSGATAVASPGLAGLARANLYAILGTAAVAGAMYGVNWYINSSNRNYYEKTWELVLAGQYQNKQAEYIECVRDGVGQGIITEEEAAAAGFGQDIYDNALRIARDTYAAGRSALQNANNVASNVGNVTDVCGSLTDFSNIMNWVVCQTAKLAYEVLAWFVAFAASTAQKSIGVDST